MELIKNQMLNKIKNSLNNVISLVYNQTIKNKED